MEADLSAVRKKAVLICGGAVKVSQDFRPPFRLSRSTAGPGAGSSSIVLAFNGLRVKKSISREEGEFELVGGPEGYSLLRNGSPFIDELELKPVLYHSPEQAFFNLGQECIFNCIFCTSPKLAKDVTKDLDLDKVVELILEAERKGGMKGVAFTSAVVGSIRQTIDRMVYVVGKVRHVHALAVAGRPRAVASRQQARPVASGRARHPRRRTTGPSRARSRVPATWDRRRVRSAARRR